MASVSFFSGIHATLCPEEVKKRTKKTGCNKRQRGNDIGSNNLGSFKNDGRTLKDMLELIDEKRSESACAGKTAAMGGNSERE